MSSEHSPAQLAAPQELARQFIALGYHAAYGDRLGVEIRQDDASAILAILREHAAQNHSPAGTPASLTPARREHGHGGD